MTATENGAATATPGVPPETGKAHETVEDAGTFSDRGGGRGWGVEEEKGSRGWRKEFKGQEICTEREERASKAERVPRAGKGDSH